MLSIYNAIFSDLFYYPKSRHRISNSGGTIRNSATQIWYTGTHGQNMAIACQRKTNYSKVGRS